MTDFEYKTAFDRNVGILTEKEQQRLRGIRVALAGMGGVGGIYALALARMGIGRFSIADGDRFELANFNRQMGADAATVGRNKAEVVAERIRAINPEADVTVFDRHLDESNIGAFLQDAEVVVDGIETFAVGAHRLIAREARRQNQPLVMAAPLGFSAAMLCFDPQGMTVDDYFNWQDGQANAEQVVHFALGLAPAGLHLNQIDFSRVDITRRIGPSNVAACLLCAGLVATETARLALGRPGTRFAPAFVQFDGLTHRLRRGRLPFGNRGLGQRVKKWWLLRRFPGVLAEPDLRGEALEGMVRP